MRYVLIAILMSLFPLNPAVAQLSVNFGSPGVSIGVNFATYPTLQRVPGYPVYYSPRGRSNYFFYDGLYWVYEGDNWYSSSWYNGPWWAVDPFDVPVYVLRVPVRYYYHAPAYFQGWGVNDAPRWGDYWGSSWQQRRSGWDQWNRSSAPAPAPLPLYQRQYSGSRYPAAQQQAVIQTQNYRFQPKDPVAQQHFQQQQTVARSAPAQPQRTQPATRAQQQAAPQQQATQPQRQQQAAPKAEARQQQTAPKPQPQQAQRQQPSSREPTQQTQQRQQAPKEKPQQVERKPQPAPAQREQRAPPPQAQQRAPQAKEPPAKGKAQDDKEDKGKGR